VARPQKPDNGGIFRRLAGGASERVLNVVDPNQVLEHVDVDHLLDRVDVNALLDRVDVNALLDRVEPDQILDRVDVNRILDRVDVDALLARADMDALMDRVDVASLVDRAGIPQIVADSTSHLTGSALDMFRRPLVGLDLIFGRALNRIIGRDQSKYPSGPSDLVDWVGERAVEGKAVQTGRYAGPLTRLLAVVVDSLVITFSFTLMVSVSEFALNRIGFGYGLADASPVLFGLLLGLWGFMYLVVSLAVAGKTVGKALLGLRVVSSDGDPALARSQPLIRVLTYPLSFVLGLGLLGIVWGRERRAWHDRLAGTAVVYDWGSRTATLPTPLATFLERKREAEEG
jgi:uncharacterized RDD family membrane protein YckC